MTKLIDDGLRRLRRLRAVVRFLDNLFLPRDRGDAVHQHKQVYLDGEGERNKSWLVRFALPTLVAVAFKRSRKVKTSDCKLCKRHEMSVGRRICVESRNAQLSKIIRFPPARLNIKIQFVCWRNCALVSIERKSAARHFTSRVRDERKPKRMKDGRSIAVFCVALEL